MNDFTNLQQISQEEAMNLTKFFIGCGKNILLFGKRGTGKTEIILQAIKECNLQVNYINLSVMERCDLGGYPNIASQSDIIDFKYPHFLPKLKDGYQPNIVWVFDEIDKCSPETTAPLLEILQFRKVNGVPLNIAACVLTSNLLNENAYSHLISSALLDRVAKYSMTFNFPLWMDWAKANGVHDLILGFLGSDPSYACGTAEDSAFASPSPRGWTWASQALLKAKELKMADIDSVSQIISGYVGSEAGLKFKVWYEHYRKFEPYVHSLIEKGEMQFDFNSLMPTEKLVFVISACYFAKLKVFSEKSKNRFIYLERLCNFFTEYNIESEVQIMGLHNSFDFEQIKKHKLYQCKVFFDLFKKISENITFNK